MIGLCLGAIIPAFALEPSSLPRSSGAVQHSSTKLNVAPLSKRRDDDGEWPLLRELRRACKDYELIQPGDKIAVAVSGGKDSSTLAYLLHQMKTRRMLPFDDWSFTTIHLDQVQPGHDPSSLEDWLRSQGIEYNLVTEDTYSIVTEKTKPGQSYCSLCSRLRRGILYSAAEQLGCNRLALGHHRDDALETLLLNMCHQGQLKALPARYIAKRGMDVIRPLIYAAEADIANFANARGFPILPCNLCGSSPDGTPGSRQQMKVVLSALDGMGDGQARRNMLSALADVRPTHLLDRKLRTACGLDAASGELLDPRGTEVAHVGEMGDLQLK
jgi:tRNA 2-thiocytidine biosynthesis protein TtcA